MLKEGMKIEARHVRRKQLAQYIDINLLKRERKPSESLNSSSVTQLAKKRVSAEMMGQLNSSIAKRKLHESVSSFAPDRSQNQKQTVTALTINES